MKFNGWIGFSEKPVVAIKFLSVMGVEQRALEDELYTRILPPDSHNQEKEENITVVAVLRCKLQVAGRHLRRIIV